MEVTSARTRLERRFDPDAVRRLLAGADAPVTVGGAEVAATALRAGLVDELHQFVNPVGKSTGRRAVVAMAATVSGLRLLGERLVADHRDGRVEFVSNTEHAARAVPSRVAAAALAVITAMVIAGCGGASSTTQAPAAASATPAAASAPTGTDAGSTSGSGSGAGDCGEATAALVKAQLTAPEIISVTTEGGCHDATIVTSLAASDSAKALAICDSAAVVAYAGDLLSVTVTGANNKELAIGIKGQPCIGEP